ncbi:MAG: signal recognition particle-docking protein FtsY [endosymbiont of Galathealinum brachiosum]|uniref:Signal recognition particle receptor FtsY n=1 Tax=endosymbiont of Galathealinum brachiosum TaxID=2200906 RepID=A0A370DF70_9GAMM|nr:MAG: signal recognition particle-docking protein FtsY [endosymbiont of Galathealinum brachiosum]
MFGFLRRDKENSEVTSETDNENSTELSNESSTPAIKSGASFTPAGARKQVSSPAPAQAEEASPAVIEVTQEEIKEDAAKETRADIQQDNTEIEKPEEKPTEVKGGSSFTPPTAEEWAKAKEESSFVYLKDSLDKTRAGLTDGMADLLLGKKVIDEELLEELEMRLLTADVGVEATDRIITDLTKRISRNELKDPIALFNALCDDMVEILQPVDQPLVIDETKSPFVILVIGINGAGKTTTIGKLAKRYQAQGKSVLLAAGDTFRAAAVEQLQTWGERNEIAVVAQGTGADSASVIYDAIESAKSKNIDIVIADTAGRLHTQMNLMDELIKIKRVMGKLDDSAPHETLLVMDAGFGQNGLIQAQQFNEAMGITGLILTKLDGTAKGGILFAIAEKLGLPIRFIGVGESIDDLREFHATEFVDALLDKIPD